jgi:SAM-dependent methyltransferase
MSAHPSACSACGGALQPFLSTRDYNRGRANETFHYLRCTRCGFATLANVPADLPRYYGPGYHLLPESDAAVEAGAAHDRYKIDLVRRFAPPGPLVEIGPSWGAFCLLAKRAGYAVRAIEMDPACCEFLERRIGVRVLCRADEVAALGEAGEPDVIAAWHVMEHLRDPWGLLRAAAQRLAPGGVLVLALPNPHAMQFRLLGRHWAHVDAPRHLHLIPPEVLRARAEAEGLRQELCTTRDAGSLRWNLFGWQHSLQQLAAGAFARRALRIAGRVIAALLRPVESREGRGAAYTAVFRKPRPGG